MERIPKIIHYCWFGKQPLPALALKCIESWKKFMPDYEIKEWNESNFDVNIIPYTQEAYKMGKYAFVSDYVRFWILYNYGGIYFDTDVEMLKSIDNIIQKGAFMGCEQNGIRNKSYPSVNPGLGLACKPKMKIYEELLELYSKLHFQLESKDTKLKTVVDYTTDILIEHGLEKNNSIQNICDCYIYPSEYFCPINITTKKLKITSKTYTIHHYAASWVDVSLINKIKGTLQKVTPEKILIWYNQIKNK